MFLEMLINGNGELCGLGVKPHRVIAWCQCLLFFTPDLTYSPLSSLKELPASHGADNGGEVHYLMEKCKRETRNVNKPRILPSVLYCSSPKYKT